MSSLLQRAVRNTTWSAVGAVLVGGVGFVLSAATIRLLGVAGAGFAAAILALFSIVGTVGGLGFGTGLIREISRTMAGDNPAGTRGVARVGMMIAWLSGGLGMMGLVAFAGPIVNWTGYSDFSGDDIVFCRLAGFTFLASQLATFLQACMEGAQRYGIRTVILGGTMIGQTCATVIILAVNPSLVALGVIQLIFSCLRLAAFYWTFFRLFGFHPWPGWSVTDFRRTWDFSRWIYAGGLLSLMSSGLDRIVIVVLLGSGVLPFYILPRRFYEICHGVLTSQAGFLLPLLSASEGRDCDWIPLQDKLRWFMSSLAGWIYLSVLVLGPAAVAILVSRDFAFGARWVLLMFAIVGYFHAQAIVPFYVVQAGGHSRSTFLFQAAVGLSVLPAMMILGWKYGLLGAVAGQGAIAVVSILFAWFQCEEKFGTGATRLFSSFGWPFGLLVPGVMLNCLWAAGLVPLWAMTSLGVFVLAFYFPVLCRLEGVHSNRVCTLRRAWCLLPVRTMRPAWAVRLVTGQSKLLINDQIESH